MLGASVPGRLIPKEPRSVAPVSKVPMSWVPMPLAPMSRAPWLRLPLFRWALQLLVPAASRCLRRAMRGLQITPSRSSGATRVCPPEPLRRVRGARPGGGPGQGVPQRGDPRQRGLRPGDPQQSGTRQVRTQGMPLRPYPAVPRPRGHTRHPEPEALMRMIPPAARSAGSISAAAAGRAPRSGAARLRHYSMTARSSIATRYLMSVPGCCHGGDSVSHY